MTQFVSNPRGMCCSWVKNVKPKSKTFYSIPKNTENLLRLYLYYIIYVNMGGECVCLCLCVKVYKPEENEKCSKLNVRS